MIFERILLDLIKLEFKCHYRDALFTSFLELLFMCPELCSYQICATRLGWWGSLFGQRFPREAWVRVEPAAASPAGWRAGRAAAPCEGHCAPGCRGFG